MGFGFSVFDQKVWPILCTKYLKIDDSPCPGAKLSLPVTSRKLNRWIHFAYVQILVTLTACVGANRLYVCASFIEEVSVSLRAVLAVQRVGLFVRSMR